MKSSSILAQLKKFYESKQYSKAKELLESNQSQFEESVYLYNKGLVEFQLGNYGQSKFLAEKAIASGLDSIGTRKLIQESNDALLISIHPRSFGDHLFYYSETIGIDLILVFVSFFLAIYLLTWKKTEEIFIKVALGVILALTLAWGIYFKFFTASYIALEPKDVREGPSRLFEDSFQMPTGVKYIIGKHYEAWGQIIYPQEYEGWILREQKEKI